jgi:mannose-6-phosphate isomerase-like protein (cupin superfamily)
MPPASVAASRYSDAMEKVNLAAKLASFTDHWNPRVVAELNGQHVRVVKLEGPFTWHQHEREDELFLVLRGTLRMELRDQVIELNPGELLVVPRGVEHRPVGEGEVEVLLFEPATTVNTGNATDDPRTRATLSHI